MNPEAEPLLRDIHLPPDPSWWPLAPGWWLVIVTTILIVLVILWKLKYFLHRRNRHKRILTELDRIIAEQESAADPSLRVAALSQFLRRLTLSEQPQAAALTGVAWLQYLDARAGINEFSAGVGRVLLDMPYRAHCTCDPTDLQALVRRWTQHVLRSEAGHA